MDLRNALHYVWKIPLGMFAWFAGLIIGGSLLPLIGLSTPVIPEGVDSMTVGMISLMMSVFVVLSGALLTKELQGSFLTRWMSVGTLIFVAYGVNNALEGALFTNIAALATPQNIISIIILQMFPSYTTSGIIALLFPPSPPTPSFTEAIRESVKTQNTSQFLMRVLLSIGSFVVIYWGIGVIISPLVTPIYIAGDFELILPPLDQILVLQVLRGTLLTFVTLPLMFAWKGTKNSLLLKMGIALTILLGLFPLSLAYWISLPVRVIHILEITVDSFLFATVLIKLYSIPHAM